MDLRSWLPRGSRRRVRQEDRRPASPPHTLSLNTQAEAAVDAMFNIAVSKGASPKVREGCPSRTACLAGASDCTHPAPYSSASRYIRSHSSPTCSYFKDGRACLPPERMPQQPFCLHVPSSYQALHLLPARSFNISGFTPLACTLCQHLMLQTLRSHLQQLRLETCTLLQHLRLSYLMPAACPSASGRSRRSLSLG